MLLSAWAAWTASVTCWWWTMATRFSGCLCWRVLWRPHAYIPRLPVAPDSSPDGSVLAVAREVVGAAANALDPGFYCVLAIRTDRGVLWREELPCCREKSGVKSVAVCVERLHAMLYHS